MSTISEAEKLALSLSDSERGRLAEKLIASLSTPFIDDDDDGIDEAIRRSREIGEDPAMSLSFQELDEIIKKRFPECVSE